MKKSPMAGAVPSRYILPAFFGKNKKTIVEIIGGLFILLFLYTAISKLATFPNFRHTLSYSPLISDYATVIAIVLPIAEIIVCTLLFIPKLRIYGLYSSFILMLMFTGYIAYMLAFTPDRPCSCGGVLEQMSWNDHLIFNSGFTLLALTGIIMAKSAKRENT